MWAISKNNKLIETDTPVSFNGIEFLIRYVPQATHVVKKGRAREKKAYRENFSFYSISQNGKRIDSALTKRKAIARCKLIAALVVNPVEMLSAT